MKNIYLIGMMGAGKTSTGEALAKELSLNFVDMDEGIVKSTKMTINEIFESRGGPYFRKLEREGLKLVSKTKGQVVATGGGVVLDPENVRLMKESGILIYLRAPIETLWSRVQTKTDRPLLKTLNPKEVFAKLFYERKPLYEAIRDHAVNTEGRNPLEVAREVITILRLTSHERT